MNSLTSSNGNRNGKRNQGAANRGARAEHHHNSWLIFRLFGSRCRKTWPSEREGVSELVPIFLRIRANNGDGTGEGTNGFLTQCFSSRRLRQRLRQQHD